ncbi:hypothetical protein, partial [Bifidobacterium breve]|uniref:hypothetical protein n=1 Tax=Bifidobacterium breve TaxID=1685 RepID=UPI00374EBDA7
MGVRITVATRMLDPEEVTRSIAMPLQGDALDGLRGDFNRNVRRRLAGRSPRPGESAGTPDAQRRRPAHAGRMPCSPAASVLLQFFLSNFCTIFPQYGLPVSSRN